ncbi:MAG: protein translocase subunit SecD [Actinomycetota bacterium]
MKVRRHVILLLATLILVGVTFGFTLASDDRPVLGLDLQGGISVVKFPEAGQDLSTLDTAADVIRSRVDAVGIAEPEVSRQGNTVVIDLPGVKDRGRALELIGQTAELRFRLVEGGPLPWTFEVPETTTTTLGETTTTGAGSSTTTVAETAPTTVAATTTTVEGESAGVAIDAAPIAATRPAQEDTSTTTVAPESTTIPGETTETTVPIPIPETGDDCASLVADREENLAEATVWLPDRGSQGDDGSPDGCYLLGPALLTGREVKSATAEYDGVSSWIVNIEFRSDRFATEIAQPNVGATLAIELDGVIQSAATINPDITGRDVQISGAFTKSDAKDLELVLKYGALPIEFDESEETVRSVSPSLGKDQLRAGVVAGSIGIGLVMLFMILYYRLLGVVVWIGLGLTGVVFFTLVSYLSASRGLTLTLAGVTGLIVSVGVTVDSYVVYFERLKDEIRTGKTLRSSLDSGFRRAFRTILAADLVSLLGAVVLYQLAEGSVRGFALFLGISTLIDLAIAYFVMHPLVALLARRPALVRMPGVGLASGLDTPELRA